MDDGIAGVSNGSGLMSRAQIPPNTVLVACRVFAPEISLLGVNPERVHYLDQGLHRYPEDLRRELGKMVNRLEQDSHLHTVILAYGYCGRGLEGLSSRSLTLALPRVHDCIPLLLGRNPSVAGRNTDSTFYLSAGWVEYGRTPLTEFRDSCVRLGLENAGWVACEMLKNYRQVALIDNGVPLKSRYRTYAREMADLCDLQCCRVSGSLHWLSDLIQCRYGKQIVKVAPGEALVKSMYP